MNDLSDEALMKLAIELVSVLPKKGGTREGMKHDILHALTTIRDSATADEREKNIIKISGHGFPPGRGFYCPAACFCKRIIEAIRKCGG